MAVLNMINGVNEWFREGGAMTIDDVADAYARFAVRGILGGTAKAKRPARRKAKPSAKAA